MWRHTMCPMCSPHITLTSPLLRDVPRALMMYTARNRASSRPLLTRPSPALFLSHQRNLGMIFSQQAVLSLAHASLCLTFIFGFLGLYKGHLARVMAEVSTLSGVCATVIYTGGAAATHVVPSYTQYRTKYTRSNARGVI